MIWNYLKLAGRNISHRKLYPVINTIGLGVASAFCILVYWYVHSSCLPLFNKLTNSALELRYFSVKEVLAAI